jgi:TonB family protein
VKFLIFILFLISFVTFSQSDSETIICPPKRIEIEPVGCEEVDSPEFSKKEKDSLFSLYKVKMIPIMEDSIKENDERIMNTQYVAMINPIEISPEYPGGELALKNFIDSTFIYPPNEFNSIRGVVWVNFIIDTLGVVNSVHVVRGLTLLIDEEAQRVVENLPDFFPGYRDGNKIEVRYTVPIKITKFIVPNAYFPGGSLAMAHFIQNNYNYPNVLQETKIEGVIWTNFLVNKDGTISNIEVVKGVQKDFDKEAVRVIEIMPIWVPARYSNGTTTAVYMTVPFKIE